MRVRFGLFPLLVSLAALLGTTGCETAPAPTRPEPQPLITGEGRFISDQVHVVAQLGPFRLVDAFSHQRLGGTPVVIDDEPITNRRPRAYAGPGSGATGNTPPRQSLTITVRNTGTTPLRLRVAEVRSALGNFVPVPEIFTLEPGQLQALEPMRSSYPAPIDELELVIRLRTAGADEVQTLKLSL